MSRMLDALKALQTRRTEVSAAPLPPAGMPTPRAAMPVWHETAVVMAEPPMIEPCLHPPLAEVQATAPPRPVPGVACCLPTSQDLSDRYFELAACIGDQGGSNYSNVLLFVSPDRAWEECFSLTHLAQAFSLQTPGDVLLVDGDLRDRRLSKMVGMTGPGLGNVMLGTASWPDVIYPTNAQGIDFVSSGDRQVPTFERSQFGWSALRPQYRVVLIGIAPADQPETTWLAARCDGVYLVMSRPRTERQAATSAVNGLRACGANLLGCVVVDN